MVVKRFFSYTGEWSGFERHDTGDEARAAVQGAVETIDEAWDPGDAEVWCWGEVREDVVVTVVHTHGPECVDEDDGCPEGYGYPEEGQDVAEVALVAVPNPECGALRAELAQAREEAATLRAELAPAASRLSAALALLTRWGGIDGAHHKTWTIDQAIRVMCGVPVGDQGIPGDATNEEYLKHVYNACKGDDGEAWVYSWDEGVAP